MRLLSLRRHDLGRAGSWLGVVLLCCAWLRGEARGEVSPEAARGSYQVWRMADDWQLGAVTSLVQSQQGYLWLGTYHGLVRFDGVQSKVFDGAAGELPNGLVTSLYEDESGVLWIGHETGHLTRFSDGHFASAHLGTNWNGGSVVGLTSDREGDLWVLNTTGLLLRERDGLALQVPGVVPGSRGASLVRSRQGRVLVLAAGALFRVEDSRLASFPLTDANPDFIEEVWPANDGGLWVMGNGRLRKWRQGAWGAELPSGLATSGSVTLLRESRSGALLVGTLKDGLYLLRPGEEALHFHRQNGLSHDWIRAAIEDQEGSYWIGTGGGFDGLRPRKVKMLSPPDNWQGCEVRSFCFSPDGSVWVGTEGAGVYHHRQDRWQAYSNPDTVTNSFVWSMLASRSGEILAGTWGGGLLSWQGERFVCDGALCEITDPVPCLYESAGGDLWIGTVTGLWRRRGGKVECIAGRDQLVLPNVRAIAERKDGSLWFGMSGGGLGCWRDGRLTQIRRNDGLGSDFIVALHADPDDTLWIGSSDQGLIRLKQGKFYQFGPDRGLPSAIITHIVDDGVGNLWLGTQAGVVRATKADLDRCAEGKTHSVRFLTYGKSDGMSSQICSGGFQPGACRGPDGRLWFPTTKGLAVIDPANTSVNTVPPPVVIEALLADGTPVELQPAAPRKLRDGQHRINIPPGRQRFEFRYTGLSFIAPEKVRFRVRLEGLETDWVDAGTKRSAQYSHLPPGNYTFRVLACNNDDLWNEQGASLAFTVLPRFRQTWWFRGGILLLSIAMVAGGVGWLSRWRLHRKLQHLDRQRALERERARIARDIHDDLGASLTRITLLSQSVRSDLRDGQPAAEVDQIYSTARELTRAMDEIVWAVNPKHDTFDSLVTYLGRFAQHFLTAAGLRCRLDVPMTLPGWQLTSEIRHNVFLAFKEALNNVIKHAGATEVRVLLELQPAGFVLVVTDNGKGFIVGPEGTATAGGDAARAASGNGLANMRKRLEEIGGACTWETALGEGTRVKLSVSIQ